MSAWLYVPPLDALGTSRIRQVSVRRKQESPGPSPGTKGIDAPCRELKLWGRLTRAQRGAVPFPETPTFGLKSLTGRG